MKLSRICDCRGNISTHEVSLSLLFNFLITKHGREINKYTTTAKGGRFRWTSIDVTAHLKMRAGVSF